MSVSRALLVATLVAIVLLWLLPLRDGLWIDELGTYWVVRDGWGATVDRAFRYQGQSPLYYLLARAAFVVGGKSEVALRAPSLVAALATLLLLRRLGARLLDAEAGRAAILFFVVLAAERATEARPYALAILVAVATTASFVRWLDTGALRHAIASALLAALLLYAHYMFALVLLVLAVYTAHRAGEGRVTRGQVRLVSLLPILLAVPLVVPLAMLAGRHQGLRLAGTPHPQGVAAVLAPPLAMAALGAGFAVAFLLRLSLRRPPGERASWLLVGLWHFLPPATVFTLTTLTPLGIGVPRYWSGALAGTALLLATATSALAASWLRVGTALLVTLALALGIEPRYDDWRGATTWIKEVAPPGSALLVVAPFVEGRELDWLEDPEKRSYLLAPFDFYPVEREPRLLLYGDHHEVEALASVVGTKRIVLVGRSRPALSWADGYLWTRGYFSKWAQHGDLFVVAFDPRNP